MNRFVLIVGVYCGLVLNSHSAICQQAVKKTPATSSGKAAAKVAPKSSVPDDKAVGPKKASKEAAGNAAKKIVQGVPLTPAKNVGGSAARYIPDEVVIVAGIQPLPLLEAKLFRDTVHDAGGDDVMEAVTKEVATRMGLDVSQIEEAVVFIDMQSIDEIKATREKAIEKAQLRNGLREIGLAMHNFYDANNSFPDDDGHGDSKGNLSWRVHLLPYLDQRELYDQFNFDEPWDSDHNKALIEKMPASFKTPGVNDTGKTSIHLLTGEGTPFGSDVAPTFGNITDGTSNTIMTVMAGTDKADVWTKPGGLEVDPSEPLKTLGKIGPEVMVGLMDGSVVYLPASIEPQEFLNLARHQDGNIVNVPFDSAPAATSVPGIIVRSAVPIDAKALYSNLAVEEASQSVDLDGFKAARLPNGAFLHFPNPLTLLLGSENCIKQMIAKRDTSGKVKAEFESLFPANDAVAAMNIEPLHEDLQEMLQGAPFGPILKTILSANLVLDATGENESLLAIRIKTDSKKSAQQIAGLVNGGYLLMKAQAMANVSSLEPGLSDEVIERLNELVDSVTIEAEMETVALNLPRIQNPDAMMKELTPFIKDFFDGLRDSLNRAKESALRNPIKSMGLAMHNYHDTYNGFPSWNTSRGADANKGLSWRVHLLPYLEQGNLYQQFHLDEDWDSEHNKALVEKMPEIFECPGVEKPGYTSYHVFIGEKTPIGADKPRGMRDIIDGTSNTIMIVQAGSDTADVWTKPSGLEYDPEEPKKCLGNIGERFLIMLCDGASQFISSDVDDETLLRLIECADGQPVEIGR